MTIRCFYCGSETNLRICGTPVCSKCSDLLEAGQQPPNGIVTSDCNVCRGALWVCEDHPEKPWAGASNVTNACACGAPGVPCLCNPSDRDHPPIMPEGYRSIFNRDGWVN
jgi:hypothetical protein